MLPDIVTFWLGPLDRLRRTCLRSQVFTGHKVTVYSFDPLPGPPDGVAEAEAILPRAFSDRLRPAQPCRSSDKHYTDDCLNAPTVEQLGVARVN